MRAGTHQSGEPAHHPADVSIAANRRLLAVLFTDVVGSTQLAVELGDKRWLDLHAEHEAIVRSVAGKVHARHLTSTGDGFVLTLPSSTAAVVAAAAIMNASRELGLELRAGVHSGECEIRRGRPAGIIFHVCARIMTLAGPGEVVVSRAVRDAVETTAFAFASRGDHALRGLPGSWDLYATEIAAPRVDAAPDRTHEDRAGVTAPQVFSRVGTSATSA